MCQMRRYRASAIEYSPKAISPAATTASSHWPPGQPSTPAVDLCGLPELDVDVPSRIETASRQSAAYASPLDAATTRPSIEWSPPPSGPLPKNACTNRHSE